MNPVWQKILKIDRDNNQVTVCNKKGQKYIVEIAPEMRPYIKDRCVLIGDLAKVVKSPLSNTWFMIDYKFDPEMYKEDTIGCEVSNTDTEPQYQIVLEDYI